MIEKEILYEGLKYTIRSGDVIGKYTILGKGNNKFHKVNHSYLTLEAKCKCGKEREIGLTTLLNIKKGKVTSDNCPTCLGNSRKHIEDFNGLSGNILLTLIRNAEIRNIKVDLTMRDIYEVYIEQDKKCKLTGLPLTFKMNGQDTSGTASVDRIDSNKDYTLDNIQIIHKHINKMKMEFDQDYFIEMCKLIANHGKA